jgi:hypothetical protein
MLVQSLDEVLISQVPESAKIRKRRRIVTSDSEGECRESGYDAIEFDSRNTLRRV